MQVAQPVLIGNQEIAKQVLLAGGTGGSILSIGKLGKDAALMIAKGKDSE